MRDPSIERFLLSRKAWYHSRRNWDHASHRHARRLCAGNSIFECSTKDWHIQPRRRYTRSTNPSTNMHHSEVGATIGQNEPEALTKEQENAFNEFERSNRNQKRHQCCRLVLDRACWHHRGIHSHAEIFLNAPDNPWYEREVTPQLPIPGSFISGASRQAPDNVDCLPRAGSQGGRQRRWHLNSDEVHSSDDHRMPRRSRQNLLSRARYLRV